MSTAAVTEIQERLLQTRSQLQAVKAQIAGLKRSVQMATLTQAQVHDEAGPDDSLVWQGVGKMFMAVTTAEYDKGIENRKEDVQEKLDALSKKEAYFATTLDKMMQAITA